MCFSRCSHIDGNYGFLPTVNWLSVHDMKKMTWTSQRIIGAVKLVNIDRLLSILETKVLAAWGGFETHRLTLPRQIVFKARTSVGILTTSFMDLLYLLPLSWMVLKMLFWLHIFSAWRSDRYVKFRVLKSFPPMAPLQCATGLSCRWKNINLFSWMTIGFSSLLSPTLDKPNLWKRAKYQGADTGANSEEYKTTTTFVYFHKTMLPEA